MDPRDEQTNGPHIGLTMVLARSASMPRWRARGLRKGGAGAVQCAWLTHLLVHIEDDLYVGPGLRMLRNYASQKAEGSVEHSVVSTKVPAMGKEKASENRGRVLAIKSNSLGNRSRKLGHITVVDR